jgi:hypothetical protein
MSGKQPTHYRQQLGGMAKRYDRRVSRYQLHVKLMCQVVDREFSVVIDRAVERGSCLDPSLPSHCSRDEYAGQNYDVRRKNGATFCMSCTFSPIP